MKSNRRRVVILGVGNLLRRDDGVGVHVARLLQADPPSAEGVTVEVLDAGTDPDLARHIVGADQAIIIDAVHGGQGAGTIYRLRPDEIVHERDCLLSLHQRGLARALGELAALALEPGDVIIIGVEPEGTGLGMQLSPRVKRAIPHVIDAVIEQVRRQDPPSGWCGSE